MNKFLIKKVIFLTTLLSFLVLSTGCSLYTSEDEVARVLSPSGKVEAVLVETNGGATTSFGYRIFLVTKGQKWNKGVEVAFLYGAGRNDRAYGVNLKWSTAENLRVEYFKAKQADLLKKLVEIADQNITIELQDGIKDENAPAGGMLYNLQKQ